MRNSYEIVEHGLKEAHGLPTVVFFINPDTAEKEELVRKFGIDPHTLSSALDPEEPSRFESGGDHLAFIFKLPRHCAEKDHFLFKISSLGFFLYAGRLIVVSLENEPVEMALKFSGLESAQDVLLNMLWACVHRYLGHLRTINQTSDELESKINVSMENRYPLNLFSLEKSLVYYSNALDSDSLVLDRLKTVAEKARFSEKNLDLLEDIIIENAQCRRQAEIYAEVLATLMDARASIVGNNLNNLIKTLNIITIAIMVPTLVVSIFSMNVLLPYQNHPFAFWLVLLLSAMASLTVLKTWRGLLRRKDKWA